MFDPNSIHAHHEERGSEAAPTYFVRYVAPTVPAVVLSKRAAAGELTLKGAYPCVGMVRLDEYLAELSHLQVETHTSTGADVH